jgi:hypothetical protein
METVVQPSALSRGAAPTGSSLAETQDSIVDELNRALSQELLELHGRVNEAALPVGSAVLMRRTSSRTMAQLQPQKVDSMSDRYAPGGRYAPTLTGAHRSSRVISPSGASAASSLDTEATLGSHVLGSAQQPQQQHRRPAVYAQGAAHRLGSEGAGTDAAWLRRRTEKQRSIAERLLRDVSAATGVGIDDPLLLRTSQLLWSPPQPHIPSRAAGVTATRPGLG